MDTNLEPTVYANEPHPTKELKWSKNQFQWNAAERDVQLWGRPGNLNRVERKPSETYFPDAINGQKWN